MQIMQQPWRIFSSVAIRAVLAASGGAGGREAAYLVMQKVFEHREHFVRDGHSSGPNVEISPAEILRRIKKFSGLELKSAFENRAVTDRIKRPHIFTAERNSHIANLRCGRPDQFRDERHRRY